MAPHPLLTLLIFLGGLLLAPGAAAQTALLDVPGSGGATLFQLNDDASLVSFGTLGAGTIPTTGSGVRLMWYPGKAAFRAGRVNSTQWDEANVGTYSVAMGFGTRASGFISFAMGSGTTASGDRATAMGENTTASGIRSVAMGQESTASGDYAAAMGVETTASGTTSTAMGEDTEASGDASTAMGFKTTASGFAATAISSNTTASGNYAAAMGFNTTASGQSSVAMGDNTMASGVDVVAMGHNTTASGTQSTAMGRSTTASGFVSTAMGQETTASGQNATAMGLSTTAQAYTSLVLGQFNVITGNSNSWVATDPVLVVGNGSVVSSSNAFTLLKNGNLTLAGTLTENSDQRLKTDIQPLTGALDGLARLQPVQYRFRAGTHRPEGVHIGLIAQEVAGVFPALVEQGADGYWSVSYGKLTAVLVQALNEQQTEIEALQARLQRLEAALLQAGSGPAATMPARR